jgi:Fe-S oxidoreductase
MLLGIDRRRTLPAWARHTLRDRFRAPDTRTVSGDGPTRRAAALFVDTFTNHYSPAIGLAAVDVLEAAHVAVTLAPNGCCGRALISQGLLDEARTRALANTDALYPLVQSGTPLVFLEPSCLSAMREDAPSLLSGEAQERARQIAKASVLFEDYLERAGPTFVRNAAEPMTVMLHGHCHQKAMGLLAPAKALLSRIPGASVVDLDAGCCGLAGSFGYVREHFDVSRAIGERRLLPAARSLPAGAVLVASGVSCRHQVADFTGVRALHAAELLRSYLPEPA